MQEEIICGIHGRSRALPELKAIAQDLNFMTGHLHLACSQTVSFLFSCRYGMETFTQLIENGSLINNEVNIDDEPRYVHRGLMLDAG